MSSGHVFLLLFSFFSAASRLSGAVQCTVLNHLRPCVCQLSDGASGTVDISPLFAKEPLSSSGDVSFRYTYDPCNGLTCIRSCATGTCAACQYTKSNANDGYGIGSLDTAKYVITEFDSKTKIFNLNVTYTLGAGERQAKVGFVYNENVSKPELIYEGENPAKTYHLRVVTNGPGVTISPNATVPTNTSGPFPIQRDACSGYLGDKSLLYKAGLLKLVSKAINLNHTWAKGEYLFEYFVGVCAPPISTPLSGCYVVQKTTQPSGDISFQCLGGSVDNQVTDTQNKRWMLLSYAETTGDAPLCDSGIRRTKIFFFCKEGAGSGRPLFVVQNPLQDDCFYQFNWPTDILCEPSNSTQPSPTQSSQPLSMETALLVGLGGACLLLLAFLLMVVMATMGCICCMRSSHSIVLTNYKNVDESSEGEVIFD